MSNRDILIFDEPASMLDPIAEPEQFRNIRDMLDDRTAILISHRVGFARKNKMTRKHVLFNSVADLFRSCVYIFILLIVTRNIFENPAAGIGAFMPVFNMAGQLQTVTARGSSSSLSPTALTR